MISCGSFFKHGSSRSILILTVDDSLTARYGSSMISRHVLLRLMLSLISLSYWSVEDLFNLFLLVQARKVTFKMCSSLLLLIFLVNLTVASFRLLSSGVRPHLISQLWLSVEETAPTMILDALYWTVSIFSFDEEDAGALIGAAYTRTGLTIVV
ncbi:hypothetical protein TNCV_396731 [Trichonephila clavipes]|nr:hypothetical protein TNCV_396731 [Trichonephila clavipes]